MATMESEPVKWRWLVGVSLRMAGIILIGLLLGAGIDAFPALIGSIVPLSAEWAHTFTTGGQTLVHLTALATAILYGILATR